MLGFEHLGCDIIATMRFKKGSKVEVLNKKEVPPGSWWCAEIISGNGHTYNVRYDHSLTEMGLNLERVPRKAIRPCPPLVESPRYWVHGDIVEVFYNHSWKLAEVLRVLGQNYYFVRILGSSMEFRVHSSNIRVRQTWQDNKWFVIRKDAGTCHNGMINILPKEGKLIFRKANRCLEVDNRAGVDMLIVEDNDAFSQCFSKDRKKRLHVCSLPRERWQAAGKKIRVIGKEGSYEQMFAENLPKLYVKVDAVASPQKILGEECKFASLNNITGRSSETQRGEGIIDSDGNCYFRVNLERTEGISSSVGSCRANSSSYRSLNCPVNSLAQDLDGCSGDIETSSMGRGLCHPSEEALREDIHQLELHAYRTTLVALYVSGPLSWDQEAMMTNLRCMLHISNDEHLTEDLRWRL